jgi:MFS family permease
MYSYSVFFKPMQSFFNWDRATVSLVFSVFQLVRGAAAIGIGWLMGKHSPTRLALFGGILTGTGLILSSRVTELWQLFLTYGIIEAVGLSGAFVIATSVTSSWFEKNRGMAIGIVSSGVGLGTLIIAPASQLLISSFNWQTAYVIIGSISAVVLIVTAFFIKFRPGSVKLGDPKDPISFKPLETESPDKTNITLKNAFLKPKLLMIAWIFFTFVFCLQMIIVHLVNHATDIGISPLVAATFISIIGFISIPGRILMGIVSDRIGTFSSLMICCSLLGLSLIWLLFSDTLMDFYIFAVVFGFAYGGEVPLIPLSISRLYGIKSMAVLVGLVMFVSNIGGALGPWVGGKLFDISLNYQSAFITAIIVCISGLALATGLKLHENQ